MTNAASYVRPEGMLASAKLLIVGDQPSKYEVMAGAPFKGIGGDEFDTCLKSASINRSQCYLTYLLKDLEKYKNIYFKEVKKGQQIIGYQPSEKGQEFLLKLKLELELSHCKVIVAVGNIALYALTNRCGISKWRGSVLESTLCPGKLVVPIVSPLTVDRGQYLNRRLIIFDLLKAARIERLGLLLPDTRIIIGPSYDDACQFLTKIEQTKSLLTYDLEVHNEEVSCISLAVDTSEVMSIPFLDHRGDYFNPEQELELWLRLGRILEDQSRPLLGQNLTFDCAFLLRKFGLKIPMTLPKIHDTMIAQKIIMPDYPKGLDFITSIHTDYPYYKDEGKKWFKIGGAYNQLWQYNAMDSLVCVAAHPVLQKYLADQDNSATYDRTRAIVGPLVYMMEHGIKVDIEGIKKKSSELEIEIEKTQEQLNVMAGFELNPNSPKQLIEYFFTKRGFKIGRCDCTDEKVMKKLKIQGCAEADLILKKRKLVKLNSTYLALEKFDHELDGTYRIRCSYDPCGTFFSRLSSSENIFGTGTNLQNWPHSIQCFLMSDNDHVGYSLDLSQAENRIVARVGRVLPMIEAFDKNIDVHSLTASLLFGDSIEDIKQWDSDHITCDIGDGLHSKRYWGKKSNHSLNYDIGFVTFAMDQEIPVKQAKFIISRYHEIYPNVREVFHAEVRQDIMYNRTLTNLMGRKTMFFGKVCDELFKQAYACKPQGTVGDVINERGLNFIYYDERFKNVKLMTQTHDEVVFQIPLNLGWPEHIRLLNLIKRELETPLRLPNGDEFVIPADIDMFKRFKRGKKVKQLTPTYMKELWEGLEK